MTTLFTITEEEKTEVSYSHAIHASGFFIAFFVSLVLTCAVFFILYRTQLLRWSFYSENQEIQHELSQNHKLEHSQFSSGDLFSEDVIMNDQIIDILTFEESGNMLQALEESVEDIGLSASLFGIWDSHLPDFSDRSLNLPPLQLGGCQSDSGRC